MRTQLIFIHGGMAFSAYGDFLEYLKSVPLDLSTEKSVRWTHTLAEDLGVEFEMISPSMPNKQNAKYEEWKIWFERHMEFVQDSVVLVGWSLGGLFLAKYLSENTAPARVEALYLLGAPAVTEDVSGEDGGDFFPEESKIAGIAQNVAGNIHIMHSSDDPVVPYRHAEIYKRHLKDATLTTFEDKGHFLVEKFPELLEHIRKRS